MAPFRDGRSYGSGVFSGVGAPTSFHLYGQFPVPGFPFPLCKLPDAKTTFSELSRGGIHHKHCSPQDGRAEYARPGGSFTSRDDDARRDGHESGGQAARKRAFLSSTLEQKDKEVEDDLLHHHYPPGISSAGRKGLMSSPQSPLKSDCQPNSPTESSSSKNASVQPPPGTQDPKARNWKKYKFIVLNQSAKEEEAGALQDPGLQPYLHPSDPENLEPQTSSRSSQQSEDPPLPQSSRLNKIIGR